MSTEHSIIIKAFKAGFDAGFGASKEGFNSECAIPEFIERSGNGNYRVDEIQKLAAERDKEAADYAERELYR